MARDYPIPIWRVTLDGADLTERMRPRLLDLGLSEARGGEADQLDLRIHDHDGRMAIPNRGALLRVAIGWKGEGLVDKGSFLVDEADHSGAPDIISVRARSANLTQPIQTPPLPSPCCHEHQDNHGERYGRAVKKGGQQNCQQDKGRDDALLEHGAFLSPASNQNARTGFVRMFCRNGAADH